MEIVINRKEFLDGFVVGSSMAGKSKVLGILDNVKIRVDSGRVYVTSNSIQNCIVRRVGIESNSADIVGYEFLVNPDDFIKALKSLKDKTLSIELSSNTLTILHGKGTIEISTLGAAEFPVMDKVDADMPLYEIDSATLYRWLQMAKDFVSTDELRPQMCGMLMYAKDGELGACATDTRVLFADSYSVGSGTQDMECILPSASFNVLQMMINGTESVSMQMDAKNLSFKTTDTRLTCQLLNGRFPNFKAVIPRGYELQTGFDKTALLDSVSRVGMFSDKSHSLIVLDIQDGMCKVKGSDLTLGKSAIDTCECIHGGDDITIGVSSEYFIRCINHISGNDIVMEMSNPTRPILFTDKNFPSLRIVVMPMNISN